MLISLDCREQYLIQECKRFLSGKDELSHIKLEEKSLPIGDIIIYNDKGEEIVIVERKTMKDLASSIRDGRYREQSFRLDACKLANHNIYYLIEGTLTSLGPRFEKKTILSSLTTISYHKGFSLYRTLSIAESAEWLIRMTDKLHRTNKPAYYKHSLDHTNTNTNTNTSDTSEPNNNDDVINYVSVCKRVKKNNITPDNIGAIMLMQIPGVSAESAKTVMSKYKNIKNLIKTLQDDPNALDALSQITKTGKERKLNKTVKSNIYNYLVANNSGVIVLN